jgi:hypothetical protein
MATNLVKVQYIGRHADHKDAIYGTGNWFQGQVKLVDSGTADRMFKHFDAYVTHTEDLTPPDIAPIDPTPPDPEAPVDQKLEVVDKTVEKTPEEAKQEFEEAVTVAKDSIRDMNRDALLEYAAVHFGQKLPGNLSRDAAHAEVSTLIDRFGPQ